jgi:glycosyltransferase involved in cell wall biosynthesis
MKIAILSNFKEFNPGYSLSGIVADQCRMLVNHGHEVDCFVAKNFKENSPIPLPPGVKVKRLVPHPALTDYRVKSTITDKHLELVAETKAMLLEEIPKYKFIITHDWIFTGWNMPYALAMQEASREIRAKARHVKWGHWIHSVPTALQDWWEIRNYGPGHKIVYPNRTDAVRVAEQFRGKPEDVRVVPHIKDLRSFWDLDPEICRFIDDHPGLMQNDVVQVYPASTDRLEAKNLREVLILFAAIKRAGFSVFLCIANQHYRGKKPKEAVEKYIKIGSRNDLEYGKDFVFTAQWDEKQYGLGLPRRMVRELMLFQNLFSGNRNRILYIFIL